MRQYMGKQYDSVTNAPLLGATFGVFSRGRTDDVAPGRRADGRTTPRESAGAWSLWVRGRRTTDDGDDDDWFEKLQNPVCSSPRKDWFFGL